ncbi:hypothetical protein Bca52824_004096 [Brassica carinata]|uniref:Uncharacterized protein n=1 Tax=Brassica carinata TaxID=52824 RepID=A0A8X7WNU2_BRACI|nr:hypothetical protein Bca52824_004096 [Brassica carinata]
MSSSSSFPSSSASSSSSAASSSSPKAIRASSAHRDSSLSSAYSSPPVPTPPKEVVRKPYEYTSMKSLNEPKRSFWGSLASKAKALLDDEDPPQSPTTRIDHHNTPSGTKEAARKTDNPSLQRSLDAITSSFNYIGTAVEEGITAVEAVHWGSFKKHVRRLRKAQPAEAPEIQADLEIQLKASDVAMAMAAKAKLLLRELKMVKSDLAFAKQRSEDHSENSQTDNDDLVRLQLETLLAEKARLAHENSIYTRENLYLRGVVEYHQLTMQDVVYFDEKTEEVTEVYPINVTSVSSSSDISNTHPNPQVLEFK